MAEPQFVETGSRLIESETLALFERFLGKELYPGQLERLLVDIATAIRVSTAMSLNETAKQNLVNYAIGTNLDELGRLTNTERLTNTRAQTVVRFALTPPIPIESGLPPILLPQGLRVRSRGGEIEFEVIADRLLSPGAAYVDVTVESVSPGSVANGLEVGAIDQLANPERVAVPPGFVLSLSNLEPTQGGFEREPDEAYRDRIRLSLNRYGAAGSVDAYKFYALSSSPSILDVDVISPRPCFVDVYVLTDSGEASEAILDQVRSALNGEKVRPVCDVVKIESARSVAVPIVVNLFLSRDASASSVVDRVLEGVRRYATELRYELGRGLVRSQLLARVMELGAGDVFNAAIASPSQDILPTVGQYILATSVSVNVIGFEGIQ